MSQSRYGRGGRGGRGGQRGQRADYQEVVKENERFERFYNDLNLVEELEREEFWAALRRELPHSFRFTGSKGYWFRIPLFDGALTKLSQSRTFCSAASEGSLHTSDYWHQVQ